MNAPGFDALAKAIATRSSRRAALKSSIPAIAAVLGSSATLRHATAQEGSTPEASPAASGELRVRKNVTSLTPAE